MMYGVQKKLDKRSVKMLKVLNLKRVFMRWVDDFLKLRSLSFNRGLKEPTTPTLGLSKSKKSRTLETNYWNLNHRAVLSCRDCYSI